jgi:spermidine synthase
MTPSPQTDRVPILVPACFFVSGFAGLALEMVWSRMLALHIGGSAEAVTAVVTAYMAGLGLGSLIVSSFTSRIQRPLRSYALLEIAVGLFALASPLLLHAPEGLYRLAHDREEIARALPFAVRFGTSLALLMIPTLAMGATLPLLVEDLTRRGGAYASRVAMLYGINTVGAVAGTAVAGFVLLPGFGNTMTLRVAAGLDLLVAVLLFAGPARKPTGIMALARPRPEGADTRPALRVAAPGGRTALADTRGTPAESPTTAAARAAAGQKRPKLSPPVESPPDAFHRGAALAAFAISGALAMTYELGWTRRLATLLGSSVYSFAILLATFLAGLGLGALLVGPLLRVVRRPLLAFAAALGLTGVAALAGTALLNAVPGMLRDLLVAQHRDPQAILTGELGFAALVLLPAALLLGAVFPLAARVAHRQGEGGGHAIGRAYAVNTAGTVLGAAGAGLFLLPALGSLTALAAAGWTHIALGIGLALLAPGRWGPRLAIAAIVAALGAGVRLASPTPDIYRLNYGIVNLLRDIDRGAGPPPSMKELQRRQIDALRVLSMQEGRAATVAVVSRWEQRQLTINGKVDASSSDPTEVLLGQLPMILADSVTRVLVIGYGSGITTHSVLTHRVGRVETVELEPAVVHAGRFFADLNGQDRHDPRSVVHFEDGRTHLAYTRALYDVIVSEPSNPWIAGINNLFTAEFYRLVRQRLASGGLFCQWLHGYDMSRETLASLLGTLGEVFPGAEVYKQNLDFLVVWKQAGAFPTRARLEGAFADPIVRADLERVGFAAPADLLALYLGPLEAVAARDWRPNTDDNGLVEFRAPLDLLRRGSAQAWNTPPLASLRLQRYDPQMPLVRTLATLAEGVARRRELERMIELAPALAAAGATGQAEAMRAAITRVSAGRAAGPRADLLSIQSDAAAEAGDFERCEALLREALALEPDDPDLLFRHGHALVQLGRPEPAERALRAALEQRAAQLVRRPGAGEPYQAELLLGIIASARGGFDEAIAHFGRARDLNPCLTGAHQLLAATYEVTGRRDEARRAVVAGLAVDPHDPRLREIDQRLRATP